MKFKVLLGIVLIIILTACTSAKQTVVSDEVIFYGEGDDWNVRYIYNPELYEEKKVNWMEIEWKDSELFQKDIDRIDIEIESREGGMYGIKISKRRNGLFNKVSAKPKAAVCPNCGYVSFYIDEYKEFSE